MREIHVQVGTFMIGVMLLTLGGYVAWGQVESGQSWGVWSAAVVLAPISAGVLLVLPGPTERVVRRMAPYVPFLEDPEAEDAH